MDHREERGRMIAESCRLDRRPSGKWEVPSQSGDGRYTVDPNPESPKCSCPDFELRGMKCKHLFAVEFAIRREQNPDGSTTVTRTMTVTEKIKRPTYPQVWPAYNAAQTHEKEKFLSLLSDLCRGVEDTTPRTKGQPRLPLSDALFACCYKIYSGFSGRRFMSDLRAATEAGYLSRTPHFNSIFNYLENPAVGEILRTFITQTALPLKTVEQDFACDSSGFTTSRFIRWYDKRYGVVREHHEWVKVHIMVGTKTNVVTAVEIRDKDAADSPQLPDLVAATAANFRMKTVCGDKGYSGVDNHNAIVKHGATPFIAFKSHTTGAAGGVFEKMFHYFQYRREDFLKFYHRRSNVESTFAMIKAKFGDALRSKTEVAMKNEALAKLVCHNIVCLIHEMYELGIEPEFWQAGASSPKVG